MCGRKLLWLQERHLSGNAVDHRECQTEQLAFGSRYEYRYICQLAIDCSEMWHESNIYQLVSVYLSSI